MLHRKDGQGLILISQPAHAWISGQLARQWNREAIIDFEEEVFLAAEQHDIGFLAWEEAPEINPKTGLPHSFMDLPVASHLAIWTRGIRQMPCYNRYSALLVSRHFSRLAETHGAHRRPEEKVLVEEFLREQRVFQEAQLNSLRHDVRYGERILGLVPRHQQLISIWDWMSLLLCHGVGVAKPEQIVDVPMAAERQVTITLSAASETGREIQVAPWPFRAAEFELVCEGRRWKEEDVLNEKRVGPQEALRGAEAVVICIRLLRE